MRSFLAAAVNAARGYYLHSRLLRRTPVSATQPQGHDKTFNIIVNGTQEVWTDHRITYEQVVQLAYPGSPTDILFTVSFANPHGKDGTLAPSQETQVKDGITFNVGKTNRS